MGEVKVWLEGFGDKPAWVGEEDTGAAVQVDRAFVQRVKDALAKILVCLRPRTVQPDAADDEPLDVE